ncbi:MAG TPA: hypothetical protein VHY08_20220 [Bacillota bacterium]|nr:hypothetical protein [Bacillota bacterium]
MALYFIQCLWVHGYNKGMGNMHGRGIGKSLLRAAEEEVKELGAKGMAAWGMEDQASWFRAQGFIDADSIGVSFLLWKAFVDDAEAPCWIQPRKTPEAIPGKVTVRMFINGWCTDTYEVVEFVRKAVAGCDDRVIFQEIDTSDSWTLQEWGIENAMFIDGDCVWSYTDYPPPTPEEIRNKIEQKLGKSN